MIISLQLSRFMSICFIITSVFVALLNCEPIIDVNTIRTIPSKFVDNTIIDQKNQSNVLQNKCREFFATGNYSGPLAEMCRDLRRRSIIKARDIKTDDDNMEELYLEAEKEYFTPEEYENMQYRVINGYNVFGKNHPWTVSLSLCSNGCELCGGTIIAPRAVVTAKHCVEKNCKGTIFVGDTGKKKGERHTFRCQNSNVVLHGTADIAIIKTKKKLSGKALALPVGPEEEPKPEDAVFVLGWGRVCDKDGKQCTSQSDQSDVLQGITINVVADSKCEQSDEFTFCAGGFDKAGIPRDACVGDSGGTMECKDKKGNAYLCGTVSSGPAPPDCGKSPGAYIKVGNEQILKWIKDNAAGASSENRQEHVWETKDVARSSNALLTISILSFSSSLTKFLLQS